MSLRVRSLGAFGIALSLLAIIPLAAYVITILAYWDVSRPPDAPIIYGRVRSPSGDFEVQKIYRGDSAVTYDLRLVGLRPSAGESRTFVSAGTVPGIWGSDGIVLGWLAEDHLRVAWPYSAKGVSGPRRVGGINIDYSGYEPDLDRITAAPVVRDATSGATVAFSTQVATTTSPDPRAMPTTHMTCELRVQASPTNAGQALTIRLIAEGDSTPSNTRISIPGTMKLRFELEQAFGTGPGLTQAILEPVYPENDRFASPQQTGSGIEYDMLQLSEVSEWLRALRAGSAFVKYSADFGHSITPVSLRLDKPDSTVIATRNFISCARSANVFGIRMAD